MHIRLQKARHQSRVICLLILVGCPSLLYIVVGAYPINNLSDKTTTNAPALQTSKGKQTLESMPPQNSKHQQEPFRNDANFVNHPGAADIKIQQKSPEFLLDMRYFCNFSLVSLGIRPRSRRCAERTRQGEGRWSRPRRRRSNEAIRPRIPVPRIAYLGRDKKKILTKSLKSKNDLIYVWVSF